MFREVCTDLGSSDVFYNANRREFGLVVDIPKNYLTIKQLDETVDESKLKEMMGVDE